MDDLLAEMANITGRKSVIPDAPQNTPSAPKLKTPYDDLYEDSGRRHGVDPDLLRAMGKQESSYNPNAVSPKGATGVMQFMPATAKRFGITDVRDPKQSIEGGAKYMKFLLNRFGGDVDKALAGYNAGEGAVDKYKGIPPFRETQDYVKRIRSNYGGKGLLGATPEVFKPLDLTASENLLAEMKAFTGADSSVPKAGFGDNLLAEMKAFTDPQNVSNPDADAQQRAALEYQNQDLNPQTDLYKQNQAAINALGQKTLTVPPTVPQTPVFDKQGNAVPAIGGVDPQATQPVAPTGSILPIAPQTTPLAPQTPTNTPIQTGSISPTVPPSSPEVPATPGLTPLNAPQTPDEPAPAVQTPASRGLTATIPQTPQGRIVDDKGDEWEAVEDQNGLGANQTRMSRVPQVGKTVDQAPFVVQKNPDGTMTSVPSPSPAATIAPPTEADVKAYLDFKKLPDTAENRAKFAEDLRTNSGFGKGVAAGYRLGPNGEAQSEQVTLRTAPAAAKDQNGAYGGAEGKVAIDYKPAERPLIYQGATGDDQEFRRWADSQVESLVREQIPDATGADIDAARNKFPAKFGGKTENGMAVNFRLRSEFLVAVAEAKNNRELGRIDAATNTFGELGGGFGVSDKTLENAFRNGITVEELMSDPRMSAAVATGSENRRKFDDGVQSYLSFDPTTPVFVAQVKAARDLGWIPNDKADAMIETEEAALRSEWVRQRDILERENGAASSMSNVSAMRFGLTDRMTAGRQVSEEDINARIEDLLRRENVGSVTALREKRAKAEQLELARQARVREAIAISPLHQPLEFAKNIGLTFLEIPAEVIKFLGNVSDLTPWASINEAVTGKKFTPVTEALRSVGQSGLDYFESLRDEDMKGDFVTSDLPKAVGQTLSQVLLAPVTGGAILLYPIAQSGNQAFDDANKSGANRLTRAAAVAVGTIAALPDVFLNAKFFRGAIPKEAFLGKLSQTVFSKLARVYGKDEALELTKLTVRSFAKQAAAGFPQEFGQEYSEDVINGVFQKLTYKPEMTWDDVFAITPDRLRGYLAAGFGGLLGGGFEAVSEGKEFKSAASDFSETTIGDRKFVVPESIGADYARAQSLYQKAAKSFDKARAIAESPANVQNAETFRTALDEAARLTNEAESIRFKADKSVLKYHNADETLAERPAPMSLREARARVMEAVNAEGELVDMPEDVAPVENSQPEPSPVENAPTPAIPSEAPIQATEPLPPSALPVDNGEDLISDAEMAKLLGEDVPAAQTEPQPAPVAEPVPASPVSRTRARSALFRGQKTETPASVAEEAKTPRIVRVGSQDIELTDEQSARWTSEVEPAQAKLREMEAAAKKPMDAKARAKLLADTRDAAATLAKVKRDITGLTTKAEQKAAERAAKTQIGDAENADGRQSTRNRKSTADYTSEAPTGETSVVVTESGNEATISHKVIDSKDILTSFDEGYPQELQPRDRSRKASDAWIATTAGKLDPRQLVDSVKAADGRPLVVPVTVNGETKYAVVSGNGRTAAIRQAYENGGETAQKYRDFISNRGDTTGDAPIFVGVLDPKDVGNLAEFAADANVSSQVQMSPTEQAVADAEKLDGPLMAKFAPSEDGEIDGADNREFVSAFNSNVVASSELNTVVDKDGNPNSTGLARIRRAIFAFAFGDSPAGLAALERIAESTDNNVRNISNALIARAPQFARLRELIARGDRYADADIGADLARAMEKLSALRVEGVPVEQYVTQAPLFNPELTPFQMRMLQVFDLHKRSPQTLRGILDNYFASVEIVGNPNQGNLFGGDAPFNVESVFAGATEAYEKGIHAEEVGVQDENQGRESGLETGTETNRDAREKSADEQDASGERESDVKNEPLKKLAGESNTADLEYQRELNNTENVLDLIPAIDTKVTGNELKLSVEAGEIMRSAIATINGKDVAAQPNVGGLFLDPKAASDVESTLREFADIAREEGYDGTALERMADDVRAAAKGNGTVVLNIFDDAVVHERGHETDYLAAAGRNLAERVGSMDGQGGVDEFLADPAVGGIVQKAFDKFFTRHGYDMDSRNARAIIVQETWNYIQTQEGERLRLTPEEEAAFAYAYMKAFTAKHGATVLDTFSAFYKQYSLSETHLEKVRNEIGQAQKAQNRGNAENAQTGDGSSQRGGDRADGEGNSGQTGAKQESSGRLPDGLKESRTPKTLTKNGIPVDTRLYTGATNAGQQEFADRQLDKGIDSARQWLEEQIADNNGNAGTTTAVALSLMNHFGKTGDIAALNDVADKLVPMLTEAGQAIQAMALVSVYNPDTAGAYAAKVKKQKTGKDLTAAEHKRAVELARELSETAKADGAKQELLDRARREIRFLADEYDLLDRTHKTLMDEKAGVDVKLENLKKELEDVRKKLTTVKVVGQPRPGSPIAKLKQSLENSRADLERQVASVFKDAALKSISPETGNETNILRSISPDLPADQKEALSKLVALDILDGKAYDDTIAGLRSRTNDALTQDQIDEIHAAGEGMLRTDRTTPDDVKAARKIRGEHKKAANTYLKRTQTLREAAIKEVVKAMVKADKAVKPVDKVVEFILQAATEQNENGELKYSDAAIFAAVARKADAKSIEAEVRKQNPNATEREIRKLVRDGDLSNPQNLAGRLKAEFPKLTNTEIRAALRDSNAINETAKQSAARFRTMVAQNRKIGEVGVERIMSEREALRADAAKATRAANQFYDALTKSTTRALVEGVVNYRKANLLTGPKTHIRNLLGNVAFAASEEGARAIGSLADIAVSRVTGRRTLQGISPTGVMNGFAALVRADESMKQLDEVSGLKAAYKILRQGDTSENLSKQQIMESNLREKIPYAGAIADTYINMVFRTLSAEDALFKTFAFRRALEELAAVEAKNSGKTRADILANPTSVMQERAREFADSMTFQDNNALSQWFSGAKGKMPYPIRAAVEIAVPFDRTPTNIVLRSLEHTPLGFVRAGAKLYKRFNPSENDVKDARGRYRKAVVDDLSNEVFDKLKPDEQRELIDKRLMEVMNDKFQREFSSLVGRSTVGTFGFVALGFALASQNLLAGAMDGGDDDRKERNIAMERRRRGIEPGAVRVPGVGRFKLIDSPATKAMIFGATMYEQADLARRERKDLVGSAVEGARESAANLIFEQPLLKETSDLLKNRDTAGGAAGNIASGLIPASGFFRSVGEVTDDEARRSFGYSAKEEKGKSFADIQATAFQRQVLQGLPVLRWLNPISTATVPKEERGGITRRFVREFDPTNYRSTTATKEP